MPKNTEPIEAEVDTTEPAIEDSGVELASRSHVGGPVVALLAVALITVLGLLYWWFATMQATPTVVDTTPVRPTAAENNEPESATAEAQSGSFFIMSNSDEIDSIEADLESTNLESLDTELAAIEAELEASSEAEAQ